MFSVKKMLKCFLSCQNKKKVVPSFQPDNYIVYSENVLKNCSIVHTKIWFLKIFGDNLDFCQEHVALHFNRLYLSISKTSAARHAAGKSVMHKHELTAQV